MKVAIMNPWAISDKSIGGTERFVEDLAETLVKLGNMVDVYIFSGVSHIKNNVSYISLDLFGKNIIADEYIIEKSFGSFEKKEAYQKMALKLEKMIDVSKYDIIQINSPYFLTSFSKKKRIITLHANYQEFMVLGNNQEFKMLVEVMQKEVKNKNTRIVCPSLYYQKEWENILNNNVYFIPHALNKKRLECSISKDKLLKKYALDKEKIKILLPSRLEMIQKQPDLILEGCSLLEEEAKNKIQIIFTGIDSQYKNNVFKLKHLAQKYHLDAKFITFDTMAEAYKIADIVAVPSKSESFGYAALESLSLGIKTILTSIPTFKEISNNNNWAYFFDGTKEDLKVVLLKILSENNFKRKKVNPKWLERYDLELFAKNYIGVFNDEK